VDCRRKGGGDHKLRPPHETKFAKSLPYAFTEHCAIRAASVLNSSKAVKVSVFVVRAFVQLGEVIAGHRELAHKITARLICGVRRAGRNGRQTDANQHRQPTLTRGCCATLYGLKSSGFSLLGPINKFKNELH
jgi:hypothetical protein